MLLQICRDQWIWQRGFISGNKPLKLAREWAKYLKWCMVSTGRRELHKGGNSTKEARDHQKLQDPLIFWSHTLKYDSIVAVFHHACRTFSAAGSFFLIPILISVHVTSWKVKTQSLSGVFLFFFPIITDFHNFFLFSPPLLIIHETFSRITGWRSSIAESAVPSGWRGSGLEGEIVF